MKKPECLVMVGLPATGKSTVAKYSKEISEDVFGLDVFVYSTDQFIEDVAKHFNTTYDKVFKDNIEAATESMNELLEKAIEQKKYIIWDQTNLTIAKRSKIIKHMQQAGYKVKCSCIIPPKATDTISLSEWVLRLKSRAGKTIPDSVMKAMYDSYVEPSLDEGFDWISFYNLQGIVTAVAAPTY